jgi:hypothetical protein
MEPAIRFFFDRQRLCGAVLPGPGRRHANPGFGKCSDEVVVERKTEWFR